MMRGWLLLDTKRSNQYIMANQKLSSIPRALMIGYSDFIEEERLGNSQYMTLLDSCLIASSLLFILERENILFFHSLSICS